MNKYGFFTLLTALLLVLMGPWVNAQTYQEMDDDDDEREVHPINGFVKLDQAERPLLIAKKRKVPVVFYTSQFLASSKDHAYKLQAPMTHDGFRGMTRVLIYEYDSKPDAYTVAEQNLKKLGGTPRKMFFTGPDGMPLGSIDPVGKRDLTKFASQNAANILRWYNTSQRTYPRLAKTVSSGRYQTAIKDAARLAKEDREVTRIIIDAPAKTLERMKNREGVPEDGPQYFYPEVMKEMRELIVKDAQEKLKEAMSLVADGNLIKARQVLNQLTRDPIEGVEAIEKGKKLLVEVEEAIKNR